MLPMSAPELVVDYVQRTQFIDFHHRWQRLACVVTHRRAGKTVACIHDLQGGAIQSDKIRPRFAYLSPFLKQSKTVAWDYLRAAMAPARAIGASFFFQAEDGIRDYKVTGVQTCALPI